MRGRNGLRYFSALSMLALVLIISMVGEYKDRKQCTESVTATVVDYYVSRTKKSRTYYPIFRYMYQGKEYQTRSSKSSSKFKNTVGKSVKIYVDPKDPNHIYLPGIGKSTLMIGVIIIAVAGVSLTSYWKKRRFG